VGGRTSNGSGIIKMDTNKIVYIEITNVKNSFHYLDLKFFSMLVFQREIFIINFFGEVRIGI